MKGNNIILIVVGALFLVALGWFGLGGGWGADESFDEEYADWTYELGFNPSDKSPYGTYVLRELMDSGLAEVKLKLIETHLDLDKIGNKDGIYMFIDYLIFEFRDYGDNGLGSYSVWISGWIGLVIGILFSIIGIGILKSDKE